MKTNVHFTLNIVIPTEIVGFANVCLSNQHKIYSLVLFLAMRKGSCPEIAQPTNKATSLVNFRLDARIFVGAFMERDPESV